MKTPEREQLEGSIVDILCGLWGEEGPESRAALIVDAVQEAATDDDELYAGFYQGLAWAQGATDGPLKFGWPDELMRLDALAPLTFRRPDFFAVVADLDDESFIHLWEGAAPGNSEGTLWCTEDRTPHDIPETALHASQLRG